MRNALGEPIHFSLVRSTDASVEPFTTAEAKLILRVDTSADDAVIDRIVKSARQKVEADTGRALITQSWTMTLDAPPAGRNPILLPIAPVASITSIKSYATDDTESTVSSSVYRLDSDSVPARIVLKDNQTWPSSVRPENALQVIFAAGYGAAGSNVKDTGLLQAVSLLMAHWYEHREAVGELTDEIALAYRALIGSYVVPWL